MGRGGGGGLRTLVAVQRPWKIVQRSQMEPGAARWSQVQPGAGKSRYPTKVEAMPVESVMVSLLRIKSRHDASYGMLTSMQSFAFDLVGPINPSDVMQHVLRDWNDPSPCMFIFLAPFIPPITSFTHGSK